ncbi:alkaline phosphatase [Streptomyces ficellus]|uniref:Alkaline phosphatase n=2 Tax=Streptomyces ficellus TaxID=1977088 RepID=A0A6I6F0C5_9ACTN|nr:alkaline phosphatase [Streptomyces ficellus]
MTCHMDTHLPELRAAARRMGRRHFLTVAGAAAALAFTTHLPAAGAASRTALDARKISAYPFTLGIASGDPLPDSVLLWTRLAPAPFEPDGGLPAQRVEVQWEVAYDEQFYALVRSGTATAHPEYAHSVHVEVPGLDEDRSYYYRFRAGTWISPVGRARTAPSPSSFWVPSMSFAAVACAAYFDGYYTAYKHVADEDVDMVVHLGDYIYEYGVDSAGGHRGYTDRKLPAHFNTETVTLQDYRLRYALYKNDADLQAAHAAHPFVVTWDDHETENNYAGAVAENGVPPEEFLLRRAAAYRAYWENLPLRPPQKPAGADMRLYRRLRFGRLAQFDILDTRQYRSDQAYGDGWQAPGPLTMDPSRTMTGAEQERWLLDGWKTSDAVWNIVPQQVTFAQRRDVPTADYRLSMDAWDGYAASRKRLLDGATAAGVDNLMVLSGDAHVGYGFDLKADFDNPASRVVGTEISTTSLTSGRDGAQKPGNWISLTQANPHLKFYDGRRGYTVVRLGQSSAGIDFRTVSAVTRPGGTLSTAASFTTSAGTPGLQPA